jgi:hypothetical protein
MLDARSVLRKEAYELRASGSIDPSPRYMPSRYA